MIYTVTITRQFGSLGRPIAKKLAELLNIEYYDRDIVEKASKSLGLSISEISDKEESAENSFLNMIYPLGTQKAEEQDKIFETQAKIIRDLPDQQSCIIVGRCSDYILRNNKNCLHIFIYAPYQARLRNCVDYLRMDQITAERMIAKVDRARNNYHKKYAGYLPGDFKYKELLIDSSAFGIEGTARVLANAIRQRFDLDHEQNQTDERHSS